MTYEELMKFDATLKVGQHVSVYWTGAGMNFRGHGPIVKLNAKSVNVKLAESVVTQMAGSTPYPVDFVVQVPRPMAARRWSWSNSVGPYEEKKS